MTDWLRRSRSFRVASARRFVEMFHLSKYERVLQSQIRVSVSEFEDGDPDDIFTFGSSPTQSRSPESRIKVFVREGYINMRLFGTKKNLN